MNIEDYVGSIIFDIDNYFHSLEDYDITVNNTSIGHYEFGSQKLYDKGENLFTFNTAFKKEYELPTSLEAEKICDMLAEESIPFNRKFFDREYEVAGKITVASRIIDDKKILVVAGIIGEIKELVF